MTVGPFLTAGWCSCGAHMCSTHMCTAMKCSLQLEVCCAHIKMLRVGDGRLSIEQRGAACFNSCHCVPLCI